MKNTKLKALGYVISSSSLAALGYVSWETVTPDLRAFLWAGITLGLIGMAIRHYTYVKDMQ